MTPPLPAYRLSVPGALLPKCYRFRSSENLEDERRDDVTILIIYDADVLFPFSPSFLYIIFSHFHIGLFYPIR